MVEPQELDLHAAILTADRGASSAVEAEDFEAVMAALAKLRAPVDDFFDNVQVNADDVELRENRLRLLARIGATLGQVADFSQIEG